MGINLHTKYATDNPCYRAKKYIKPKGIMIHSTATPGVMADRFYELWNKASYTKACVHAFVDDTKVLQILPWNMRGWHCGASGNDTHIGIEICEPAGFTYINNQMSGYDVKKQEVYFRKVFERAVNLCVYLCKEYGLTEKDILCHSEGYKKGIASNHADVMHWFVKHGEDMDSFRQAVKKELEGGNEVVKELYMSVNGKDIEINAIHKDGKNYIEVRGLEVAGFKVGYNADTKLVTLDNDVKKLPMTVNGKKTTVESININGHNFCPIRSVASTVGFEVDYKNGRVVVKTE